MRGASLELEVNLEGNKEKLGGQAGLCLTTAPGEARAVSIGDIGGHAWVAKACWLMVSNGRLWMLIVPRGSALPSAGHMEEGLT